MQKDQVRQTIAVLVYAMMLNSSLLFAQDQKAETFRADPKASEVRWTGKKVTGSHNGTVAIKSGDLKVANGAVTGGTIVIDMPSITVLDLKDDSNAKLTGHLKSDDFFGVDKHPTAIFEIWGLKSIAGAKAGQPNTQVSGHLTIKGTTHPATFPATISVNKKTAKASAKDVKIDRTLYGIRYGSGKFFENLGNKMIDDHFIIEFDLVAKR